MGPKNSLARETWARFLSNRAAVAGGIFIIILILVAIFADVLFDYDEQVIAMNMSQRLLPPSAEHVFGTDDFGRDLFVRICYGTRMSLLVSFSSVFISTMRPFMALPASGIAVPMGIM